MTTRHRRAVWYGNPANQQKISELLRDPVFGSAIDLLFAEWRDESMEGGQIHSTELLVRRAAEQNGAQRLLAGLERLAAPPTDVAPSDTSEWSHYDLDNPYIPTTNLHDPVQP